MLAAGLGLAGLTSALVAALHVGSERLLAGFDALSGVPHARRLEWSADFGQKRRRGESEGLLAGSDGSPHRKLVQLGGEL